ncbi:hypothetical protein [Dysgonomonas sp. BGC7]|uniref:hypothetical protein n=1 Tax=Dysgonomonas sp. BGC7 TaxID=1658008 RepID=UPI00068249AD|nr:hypothetical protein [Dysgonomonas sp. BGC7]MBD8388721.1 hypothetical protein [Dysgonomonas sp. BGC7]
MRNKLRVIYNPFVWIAGWKAFIIGAIVVSLSVVIACYGNQYYQGTMNVRLVSKANLGYAFLSQFVSLFYTIFLFFIAGKVYSKGVRFQDVLGTVTLARYPYIIPAFFGYFMDFDKMNDITMDILSGKLDGIMSGLVFLTAIGIVMLIVVVWYIALLWNAFRVSTDIKGGKGIAVFIIVLILSDLLYYGSMFLISKFILS